MKIAVKPKYLPSFLKSSATRKNYTATLSPLPHGHLSSNNSTTTKTPADYEHTLVAALKSCSSLSAPLLQGQRLHGHILKYGHDSNIFIRNSLISLYAKFGAMTDAESIFVSGSQSDRVSCNIMLAGYVKLGRLNDACQLFDKMPGKNNITFTTMIMGLAQNGFWYEAIQVFQEMRSLGLVPNEVTMSSLLSSYSHVSGVRNGQMLHALVVKSGLEDFNLVLTNLVHVYCTCFCLGEARTLFDGMSERNIVSWNVMLNGYSKARLARLARDLFDKMPVRDVVSWGTMIECILQVENLCEALRLYRAMVSSGICPNDVMVVDIISACGQVMAFSEGQQFHGLTVKSGFDCYDFIQSTIIHFYAACHHINLARTQFELGSKNHLSSWNALISGLVRNGMMESARELFDKMPTRDVFSWSSMISGYSQTEQPDRAVQLFHEMLDSGIKPNEVTMVSMVSAVATLGRLQEGRWAHRYIINNSIPVNDNLSAAIIDMYAKCGSIKNALQVFNEVRNKVLTISPWNAIICGLAMNGHARLSLAIFSDLEKSRIEVNSITFIGVLSACCHAGLVEEGRRHFKSMKNVYNIEPSVKHYGCMVDLLGRAGRLEEADEVIKSMPMEADVVIWGTLLAASRNYGNVEMGELAAKSLSKADPSHGPARILLSSLYIDAGRLDDAAFVRREMKSQRLTRSPGYSGVI
ncbi:pentatricopeptide repeat-containing protein At5g19020, mitochondrial [Cynara cardunculus var. scolymus]|uniref:pentatricopeptide repeat-containing protein At5g19020, mitochondrial n=1 Tax=Cynara cardunculus var. scolymus TaxID=59895 RepID=UPI000D62D6DA|nr:pentatricopeptide repeat-containing protein At5g19020, mitochondrial [Cynara cardunculus var. scolymus]XP_024969062.1 pentatricopeptide repeat-containing protein At5g19020, mitochondrial [Cynara cardunculus var. scolymus]